MAVGLAEVGVGVGVGEGLGFGLAVGLGVGDGVGWLSARARCRAGRRVGDGVGLGDGLGDGVGLADGVGDGLAVGLEVGFGVGFAVGFGVAETVGWGVGVGATVGIGDGAGIDSGVLVTGTVTLGATVPPVIAATPWRFSQTVLPSTIAALTTYVAAGSIVVGSIPIVNATGGGPDSGRTWRLTSVPVSTLIRAAIDTAAGPRASRSAWAIVPDTVAAGVPTATRATSTPSVGPPVRTAVPCGFCHDFEPSMRVAKRPYGCFGLSLAGS